MRRNARWLLRPTRAKRHTRNHSVSSTPHNYSALELSTSSNIMLRFWRLNRRPDPNIYIQIIKIPTARINPPLIT